MVIQIMVYVEAKLNEIVDVCASSPSMIPLFVTDGNRIISKASGDHFRSQIGIKENKLHKQAHLETNENTCGVPPEPKLSYLDLPKKMKSKTGKGQHGKLSSASKLVLFLLNRRIARLQLVQVCSVFLGFIVLITDVLSISNWIFPVEIEGEY
ncbi:hypothetical protein D8674_020505 [Pyrus ussuriensis x Pyrus communis]|uniref:Uncharacterized protein n=1 Tax=Pyrus ussuriensis x Pyrus communis TaxID=2448454 RepID=A0A5N5HJ89_9ROSA|nr:hypothetical protein D8674_020505 [Pyrus ussuriensis x Pyrus communis]